MKSGLDAIPLFLLDDLLISHWVRSIFHLTPFNSTQMFGRVPNTLVQSEPWGLTYLNRLMNKRMITSIEFHELLETCVKLQFKPRKQTQTDR